MGLIADNHLGDKQLFGYHCCSLNYSNPSGQPQSFKTYIDGFLIGTRGDFENWAYPTANKDES